MIRSDALQTWPWNFEMLEHGGYNVMTDFTTFVARELE